MPKTTKPEGWQDEVENLIRAGKNYKETNTALKEKYGDEGEIGATAFQRYRNKVNPQEERDEGLNAGRQAREDAEKTKRQKTRPKWTAQKQKAADESKLAELLNQGLFHGIAPFCKSRQLEQKHVDEINLGGAIVGSIIYFIPDLNLDHPLIILTTRAILFYIRFRQLCVVMKEKIAEVKSTGREMLGGVKDGWENKSSKNSD